MVQGQYRYTCPLYYWTYITVSHGREYKIIQCKKMKRKADYTLALVGIDTWRPFIPPKLLIMRKNTITTQRSKGPKKPDFQISKELVFSKQQTISILHCITIALYTTGID